MTWNDLIRRPDSQKVYQVEIELARDNGGIETHTLRLITRGHDPDKTAHYYEPRISGIPSFTIEMQEARYGQSAISFGSLEIVNTDGELDTYLSGWTWLGRPVVVDLGFPELSSDQYETVFTGRIADVDFDDNYISLGIEDYQGDLWNKHRTAGDYSGTIPGLVSACLSQAGITNIDTTAWNTWAAANGFSAWYRAGGEESVSTILDTLLAPLACWYTFDRTGTFIIGTMLALTGTADLAIRDAEIVNDTPGEALKQYWKVGVQYLTTTGDSPTYATTSREDSGILTLNPTAQETVKESCLTSSADAVTVRNRWWDLRSVPRTLIRPCVMAQASALRLGHQVELSGRSRYGQDGLWRVTGLKEDWDNSQTTLGLFR